MAPDRRRPGGSCRCRVVGGHRRLWERRSGSSTSASISHGPERAHGAGVRSTKCTQSSWPAVAAPASGPSAVTVDRSRSCRSWRAVVTCSARPSIGLRPLIGPTDIFVVTDARYAPLVTASAPDLPAENVLGEPIGRNTAAAVALAAHAIDRPSDDVMVVVGADYAIDDEDLFRKSLVAAAERAVGGDLLTLGVRADRALDRARLCAGHRRSTHGRRPRELPRRTLRREAQPGSRDRADREWRGELELGHVHLAPRRRPRWPRDLRRGHRQRDRGRREADRRSARC